VRNGCDIFFLDAGINFLTKNELSYHLNLATSKFGRTNKIKEYVEFHIVVKPIIEKVLIFNEPTFVTEMHHSANPDDDTQKKFDGALSKEYKDKTLSLCMIGDSTVFEFNYDRLFSVPLEDLKVAATENVIIVNTPPEVQSVIVKVPQIINQHLGVPKNLILVDTTKSIFKQKLDSMTPEQKLMRGIDPDTKQFVKYITTKYNRDKKTLPAFIQDASECMFEVVCYTHLITKEMKLI